MKPGQIVYNTKGYQLRILDLLPNDRAVIETHIKIEGWDGEDQWTFDDHPKIVHLSELYPKPPTLVLDAEIAAKQEELASLSESIRTKQAEQAAELKAHEAIITKIEGYKGLGRIQDFIDGKITHVLMTDYGPGCEILTFEEAFRSKDESSRTREGALKLMCLFGDSKGDLQWRINYYRDGSGSWSAGCTPFCSYDEALEEARKLFADQFDHFMSDEKTHYQLVRLIEKAEKLDVVVPDAARLLALNLQIEGRIKQMDEAEAKADNHRIAIAAFQRQKDELLR